MIADGMLAYRMVDWGRAPELVEVPVPQPTVGQVLVKVAGTGLCHSDLTMMQMPKEIGEALGWRVPFTLGHEVGGWVARVGGSDLAFEVGQAVVLASGNPCGACPSCVRGQENCCDQAVRGRGYGRDGGLSEYVLVENPGHVVPLGNVDPTTAGPLTDAGATSFHAVSRVLPKLRAHDGDGTCAVVVGAGGLGAYAVQFLRVLSEATVIAIDGNPERLEVARRLGAHEALLGVGATSTADLMGVTGGSKVAAVLDFVGVDETIRAGVSWVRAGGVFGLVGSAGGTLRGPWYHQLPKDGEVFTFQGSTLADLHEVVGLAERGEIVTEVEMFGLTEVAEAYARLQEGRLGGRAVVTPAPTAARGGGKPG